VQPSVSQRAPSVPLDVAPVALEKRSTAFDSETHKLYDSGSSPQRIPSLDGLRGVSIWAVMLAHASSHFGSIPFHVGRVHDLLSVSSYFGVTTFFVISGFLITKLLLRELKKTSRIDLTRFYRRRAYRILPAALFYIAIVLCLSQVTLSQAAYALTFTTTYFFGLAPGCLLAFYEDPVHAFVRKHLRSGRVSILFCAMTICTAFLLYWWQVVLLWGLVPCLLALTISIAIERKDGFLNRGVLAWTGLLSYSLYLWQQPFLLFDGPLNYFWARILLTFAAAYASYSFIEKPILRLSAPRNKDIRPAPAPIVFTS
jgi:peptidoglycan/LPS O-acetylase OafA/YrhL